MHLPVREAEGRLIALLERAEAGEEIILARPGHLSVRLVPIKDEAIHKSYYGIWEVLGDPPPKALSIGDDIHRSDYLLACHN